MGTVRAVCRPAVLNKRSNTDFAFFRLEGYFYNGTLAKLPVQPPHPAPYNPYPDYGSPEYRARYKGQYVPCEGPGGLLLSDKSNATMAYPGIPQGFPEPGTGSYEAVGLDRDVCFDRFSRLGAYGLDDTSTFNWTQVRWMDLQTQCMELNKDRFTDPTPPVVGPQSETVSPEVLAAPEAEAIAKRQPVFNNPFRGAKGAKNKTRTAVLIRTWDTYEYHENDIQAMRSLITELSLLSGGEYHVFLFVNIKNNSEPIYTDRDAYDRLLERYVPEELRDIAVLWTEAVCKSWYPDVGEWSVYYQQWMPLQYFSKTHREFDYIWNWEMDARYIGNHYHFLEQVAAFARKQPRKYLWERNARFYFPSTHGSYEQFFKDTNRIVEESPHVTPVWGPQPWKPSQDIWGPWPPMSMEEDNFKWGVDEEAAFISLLPMWDPRETLWSYRDKLWGYPKSDVFELTGDDKRAFPDIPRRTFINTFARLSRDLLDAMHHENVGGFAMASEMWPSSLTLQHGLKGVYVPHPIWFSHQWEPNYLESVFNSDGWGAGSLPDFGGSDPYHTGRGRGYDPELEARHVRQAGSGANHEGLSGRWSQERDNVYSPDREHNFGGWSWYFWSEFPKVLYWRWLGWNNTYGTNIGNFSRDADSMKDVVMSEVSRDANDTFNSHQLTKMQWEEKHGRLCFPAILLHPVKQVHLPDPEEDASDKLSAELPEADTSSTEEQQQEPPPDEQLPSPPPLDVMPPGALSSNQGPPGSQPPLENPAVAQPPQEPPPNILAPNNQLPDEQPPNGQPNIEQLSNKDSLRAASLNEAGINPVAGTDPSPPLQNANAETPATT